MGGEDERAGGVGSHAPRREAETLKLACGVSCGGQGGQNGRSCGHSLDTGKV